MNVLEKAEGCRVSHHQTAQQNEILLAPTIAKATYNVKREIAHLQKELNRPLGRDARCILEFDLNTNFQILAKLEGEVMV